MIRINLLAIERERAKRKPAAVFGTAQKSMAGCGLMVVLAVLVIGWRFVSVTHDSRQLDADIASAQRETTRLRAILQQVQQFDQQKAQLQQRVTLIEQLRKGQTGPVHMLDQISRALPPMLWLTELKEAGEDVQIDGRCTQLTALSDFAANLEASGYFRKSVEIVSTSTDTAQANGPALIKFSLKAHFQQPGDAAAPPPSTPAVATAAAKSGG